MRARRTLTLAGVILAAVILFVAGAWWVDTVVSDIFREVADDYCPPAVADRHPDDPDCPGWRP